jgi:hypothetical protein
MPSLEDLEEQNRRLMGRVDELLDRNAGLKQAILLAGITALVRRPWPLMVYFGLKLLKK